LVGRQVRVTANYIDDFGASESLTSLATSIITHINTTGNIVITGSPIRNQVLTSVVFDADGISGTISYQWQSSLNGNSWTDIIGATSSTLLLTHLLVGKQVRAIASYTDILGTNESLTSTATTAITGINIPGSIVIAGSPIKNQVLTAVVTDADNINGAITYQWQSTSNGINWASIPNATSSTLLLTYSLVGVQVRVTASYADDFGVNEFLTSAATTTITGTNITGSIVIAGSFVRNQVLTAVVTDADGISGTINYQWQSSTNGIDWTDIANATSSTLLLTSSLVGKRVRVTASYTDIWGTNEFLISSATTSITGINITGSIVVAGSPIRNQVLTAVVTDADSISGSINYQWQLSLDGNNWTDIVGATSSTILLTHLLVGKQARVLASYADNLDTNESLISTATAIVTDIEITGKIVITGNLLKGELLTATVIEENNVNGEINYQWMAKNIGGNWNSIIGENDSTMLLTRSLVGKRIRVLADYVDGSGVSEYVISAETESVTNINIQGVVTIAGLPIAGGTLRAVVTDDDGLLNIPISYQWQSSIDGETWEDISEETSQAIFLLPEVIEKRIRVLAEYIDESGTEESVYSAPTDAVIPSTEDGILKITGEPRQYKVLTAIIEDLNGVNESTVRYQWQKSFDDIEWTDIAEATSNELYLKAAYQNHFIKVTSTYQTSLGNLVELTSDRTKLITSPFSSLNFVDSVNPYSQASSVNAIFTFESFPDWIVDVETGNLVPDSSGNKVIICTATVRQKKDPNLVIQPGVDYNRIYFEGYLVNPKVLLNVEQGRNVTAVINGRQGIFDFVPIMESGQEITLKQREVNGQRIAGYFRLGSLING
jgi:hypothetical protein